MRKIYLCFALLWVVSGANAQIKKGVHSFNAWVQGAYSQLMLRNSEVERNRGGVGGIIGIGYGYRRYRWLFETGLEFDYKSSLVHYSNFSQQIGRLIDQNTGREIPLGAPITSAMRPAAEGGFYHTEFLPESQFVMLYELRNLQDTYHIGYVNIPLRVGGTFGPFYFLVGPKIGVNVLAAAVTSGVHSAKGYFPQDADFLEDMPHHSFSRGNEGSNVTRFHGKMGVNLAASAEAGINVLFSHAVLQEIRIAAFADYGLLNIKSRAAHDGEFVSIPASSSAGSDPTLVKYRAFAHSQNAKSVNPFMAGLKITAVLSQKRSQVTGFYYKSDWWILDWKNRKNNTTEAE
ncbi:MAG: hypothetical protein LBU90_06020 [Bacteroidales bacterium]|jgi:hypothetical protein|nr:hypothetical protein [Bacteroidales bacterium]